jgi:hypothetical protein
MSESNKDKKEEAITGKVSFQITALSLTKRSPIKNQSISKGSSIVKHEIIYYLEFCTTKEAKKRGGGLELKNVSVGYIRIMSIGGDEEPNNNDDFEKILVLSCEISPTSMYYIKWFFSYIHCIFL